MKSLSSLVALPVELIAHILEELSYEELYACKLVCHALHDIITYDTGLQYKIGLALNGLEDNPFNTRYKAEKLHMLNQYQDAWSNILTERLESRRKRVKVRDGPAWELCGGVLGQAVGTKEIEFIQLPSSIRGIQEKTWRISLKFDLMDFTMDPGQNLLVAIEANTPAECRVHVLSMETGQRHPHCAVSIVNYTIEMSTQLPQYEIRINGAYMGVRVADRIHHDWCHVLVWEWQTGNIVFSESNPKHISFVFLGDKYLLIAHRATLPIAPLLNIVNLTAPISKCILRLPAIAPQIAELADLELLSEPSSSWKEVPEQNVPFRTGRHERSIVLVCNVIDWRKADTCSVTFTMLTSGLLSLVRKHELQGDDMDLAWEGWGPVTCRALYDPLYLDGSWPCMVYGTKRIAWETGNMIVYDFNQAATRYTASPQGDTEPSHQYENIVQSTSLESDLFVPATTTSLPYRKYRTNIRVRNINSLMMSEDSFVIVRDLQAEPEFEVISL